MLRARTQPSSTHSRSTCSLLTHRFACCSSLPAVSSLLILLLFAELVWVNTASAQACQYSPYWGQDGELWNSDGPLKDYSHAGYHEGNDPIPYQQRSASLTFGPGRHTITEPIILTTGVLRGAGMDQTTLYFPQGLEAMGHFNRCVFAWKHPQNGCDWSAGVIELQGAEVGIEDLTIEFPAHRYVHHEGKGYNGITLQNCTHCWVSHVRILQADEGIGIIEGHHNTVEHFEIEGGYHLHVHLTRTRDNLVWHGQTSGGTNHGLTGHYPVGRSVFANITGSPVLIEPDHQRLGARGLLYSNIQGRGGQIRDRSDAFLWNYRHQDLCPVEIYQAQLAKRLGPSLPPPSPSDEVMVFVNAGGRTYIDAEGQEWSQDQPYSPGSWGYVGGTTYSTGDAIANTADAPLYQTERYGTFSYQFDGPNGSYDVTLYFAETYWNSPGTRLFDVRIEDLVVLDNWDIYATAGPDAAFRVTVPDILVDDGQLKVDFVPVKDQAQIAAIAIQRVAP